MRKWYTAHFYQHTILVWTIILSFTAVILAEDSIPTLQIPVYERYPVTSNYVFSQTVVQMFRWSAIGGLAGAAGGLIYDSKQDRIFIPHSVLFGLL